MAQVIERIWRNGPRKVKRTAWGYTVQINGRQERKYDAAWSREDAEKALTARLLNVATPKVEDVHIVTFKAMTERYLKEKEISRKRTIENDRKIITRLLAFFGESTASGELSQSLPLPRGGGRAEHRHAQVRDPES